MNQIDVKYYFCCKFRRVIYQTAMTSRYILAFPVYNPETRKKLRMNPATMYTAPMLVESAKAPLRIVDDIAPEATRSKRCQHPIKSQQ